MSYLIQQEDPTTINYCLQCGDIILYGRPDRKFCSNACKNRYNNIRRTPARERAVMRILRILNRNRDILMKLLRVDIHSVDLPTLNHLGFDIRYSTSYQKVGHRQVYTCFDIQYELTPTRIRNISCLGEGVDGDLTDEMPTQPSLSAVLPASAGL